MALQRRSLLQVVTGVGVGLAGCNGIQGTEDDYHSLSAICLPCSDSPADCEDEPIPSDEEPIASSETLQALLDQAVSTIDFSECEPTGVTQGPPLSSDETWSDVAEVYDSLPHSDVLHEGYVLRLHYTDEPPGE